MHALLTTAHYYPQHDLSSAGVSAQRGDVVQYHDKMHLLTLPCEDPTKCVIIGGCVSEFVIIGVVWFKSSVHEDVSVNFAV